MSKIHYVNYENQSMKKNLKHTYIVKIKYSRSFF